MPCGHSHVGGGRIAPTPGRSAVVDGGLREASVGSGIGGCRARVDEFAEWVGAERPMAPVDLARCRLCSTGASSAPGIPSSAVARVGRLATSARVEGATVLAAAPQRTRGRPHLRSARGTLTGWPRRLAGPGATPSCARPASRADCRFGRCGLPRRSWDARLAAAGHPIGRSPIARLSPPTSATTVQIFPKLDISSRTQLPFALGALTGERPPG